MLRLGNTPYARVVSALMLWFGLALLSGCVAMNGNKGTGNQPSSSGVTVSPSTANVRAGDTQQFSASVKNVMDQSVTWSVNGMAGGDPTVGKISATGLYTAPAALPNPASITIAATSVSDKTLSGTSIVSLENPVPTVTSVSPAAVAVGNFSITVAGSKFVNGARVMFGGQALTSKFVSATQLTATGTTTASQKGMAVPVTVSNPDPGGMASSPFNVKVGEQVTVTITPAKIDLRPGQTTQFKASVTGTTNTAVRWQVNTKDGGNSTTGTISASGLYTAPSVLPAEAYRTITINAISAEAGAYNPPAYVNLLTNLPVLSAVLPTPVPVGDFTISASGSNFLAGAQVVFNGILLTTTFVSGSSLSATGTGATAGTAIVQVINPGAGSPTSNALQVQVGASNNGVTASAAARILEQSTFGPTPASISHVQQVGLQGFLTEQFNATASTYATPGANDDISVVKKRFFTNALTGTDQLRQRTAWALAQIFVVSNQKIGDPTAFTEWMKMLQKDAFGNFSTLLTDVTLSPTMGRYLDMVNNDKPGNGSEPNENYAREVLQLFSVGLAQLNPDGTPQADTNGIPVPTYTQDTIIGFAHVFTGWTYPTKPGATARFGNPEYYVGPMIPFDNHHDTGTKLLLNGATLGAGGTAQADLTAALQNIFLHPNVGPFISKQLIQHLVTSNPSPEYITRITAVFNDNGSGVRGDMKAVINAILMDPEARRGDDVAQLQPSDGKLKEPVLFMTNLLRAVNATSDGTNLDGYSSDMKEEPFESPTVFNFYPPDNQIPATTLLGPEFRIFNSTTAITRVNFVNDLVYGNISSTTTTDISAYVGLAPNPGALVDSLANVLLHGQISDNARNTIVTTISGITDNTRRTKSAIYLIGSSSQFQVQH